MNLLKNLLKNVNEQSFSEFTRFTDSSRVSTNISKVSNTISLFETSDDLMKITVSLPPGDLEKDKYRGRISKKGENDGGIHFFQYSQFMNLLNDIHDLEIALRMFQVQIQT